MIESVWLLEYRYRERKNGKWSAWMTMNGEDRNPNAYIHPPDLEDREKYQTRAVKYVRKESVE